MNAILVCSLFILVLANAAVAGDKHVHGEAELFVAIEGNKVLVELESPAANILGFEHKPSTEAQQQLLQRRLKLLGQYTSLLTFDNDICKQIDSDIESPFEQHGHHGHKEDHGHSDSHKDSHEHGHSDSHKDSHEHSHSDTHKDNHADFRLKYSLSCSNAASITSAKITAFELFEGFETIQVNWITPNKQGSSKASKRKTGVTFK